MTDHSLTAAPAKIGAQAVQGDEPAGIAVVTILKDGAGRVLEQHTAYGVLLPVPKFYANIQVAVDTPAGPQPVPVTVEITAPDVPTAFAVYDAQVKEKAPAAARAFMREAVEHMRRQQLADAGRIQIPR